MISYLSQGLWTTKSSILIGLFVFVIYQAILLLAKKRTIKGYKEISKLLLLCEIMLSVYICTILKITGIIDSERYFGSHPSNLLGFFDIPFVGASIMMVTLNFLLFVPYGFLVYFCFKRVNLNWQRVLLIGFCSSLCIEVIQAFTGRMTEIDDLLINTVGFLAGFLAAEGLAKIKEHDSRISGIMQFILTVAVSAAGLFLLSFVATGDSDYKTEISQYNEIGSPIGTLDDELAAMSDMNIYKDGTSYDALNDDSSLYEEWYTWTGASIANKAKMYSIEAVTDNSLPSIESNKIYIDISYSELQTFRFYNNQDWVMEDVGYILYCVDDGHLWYGKNEQAIAFSAEYTDSEYPFAVDETLKSEIQEWIADMK